MSAILKFDFKNKKQKTKKKQTNKTKIHFEKKIITII